MEYKTIIKTIINTVVFALFLLLASCKPDSLDLEIYASDIQGVSVRGVVDVPLTATYSLMGEDEEGYIAKVSRIAQKYLGEDAEFKSSPGMFGEVLVVKCTIPMGTKESLALYQQASRRPFSLTVDGTKVSLGKTKHFDALNKEISDVNMMLGLDLNAVSTKIRLVGDMKDSSKVTAIAVFVDNKAELEFQKQLERRMSLVLEFKGGDESVYSQIAPQFNIIFKAPRITD